MFTEHRRRLGPTRLRHHLADAIVAAGLLDAHGQPLPITPHQLRHTYATELANARMSRQALMALLGQVTPQMMIRCATLASPTLRTARARHRRTAAPSGSPPFGQPVIPDHVAWLNAEMIKTRLANRYCTRQPAQGACAYANICETCDNFTPGTTMGTSSPPTSTTGSPRRRRRATRLGQRAPLTHARRRRPRQAQASHHSSTRVTPATSSKMRAG